MHTTHQDQADELPWVGKGSYIEKLSPGSILVEKAPGEPVGLFTVSGYNEDWWNVAKTLYPVVKDQMLIPLDRVQKAMHKTTRTGVGFMPCLAIAGADYVQAIFGRKMDESDKRWLARHPFAERDGVAQHFTATCLHQFVEPYELVVSRIRLRQGAIADHKEYQAWMRSLGCNPFAVANHRTTNAEAAEQLKMPPDIARGMFRFEFGEFPLQPSVIGKLEALNSTVLTGGTLGHSTYLAPREKPPASWLISVQLAPVGSFAYNVPPVLPEYKERLDEEIVDISLTLADILAPDGTLVAHLENSKYVRSDRFPAAPTTYSTPYSTPAGLLGARPGKQHAKVIAEGGKLGSCYICGLSRSSNQAPHVCSWCWLALWLDYGCPRCTKGGKKKDKLFRVVGPPKYTSAYRQTTGHGYWEIGAVCQCGQEMALQVKPERFYARVVKDAMFGKKPTTLDSGCIQAAWDAAKPYIEAGAAGAP